MIRRVSCVGLAISEQYPGHWMKMKLQHAVTAYELIIEVIGLHIQSWHPLRHSNGLVLRRINQWNWSIQVIEANNRIFHFQSVLIDKVSIRRNNKVDDRALTVLNSDPFEAASNLIWPCQKVFYGSYDPRKGTKTYHVNPLNLFMSYSGYACIRMNVKNPVLSKTFLWELSYIVLAESE